MNALKAAAVIVCMAGPAAAQDLFRSAEMPGHRALMSLRDSTNLTPFETDGCSGGLSSGWRFVADAFPAFARAYETAPPWEGCCVTHDRAYHDAGGAASAPDSYDARLAADQALRACVIEQGDAQAAAFAGRYGATPDQVRSVFGTAAGAMYLAVRFGGGPCTGLPWRWGFGYPDCTPFGADRPARE